MSEQGRLLDAIEDMMTLCTEVGVFLQDVSKERFSADLRTQRAACMNLYSVGRIAEVLSSQHPDFVADHPEIAWHELSDLSEQIVREGINLDPAVAWAAANSHIPQLLSQLRALRHIHAQGE